MPPRRQCVCIPDGAAEAFPQVARAIRGVASLDDVKALLQEGVAIAPVLMLFYEAN